MDKVIKQYLEKFRQCHTMEEYDNLVQNLIQKFYDNEYQADVIKNIRIKAKYLTNKFSDVSNLENMEKAKENVILYLESFLDGELNKEKTKQECLKEYLYNFYFFLEAIHEKMPHKKSTLSLKELQDIQIKNEYDLQYMLYAVLKPLCPDTRIEVAEDMGCGVVRSDIEIPSLNTIIETKCTRKNMSFKKLIEEIEADIVHYKADTIYFYVYDKEKIVKDRYAFEMTFNNKFDGKLVEIILQQPVNM